MTRLHRLHRRHRRARRGTHAIEFAMCLPIWLTVISAIFDFGWLLFHQTSLDAAANMGCRSASLVDPGNRDQDVALVLAEAQTATLDAMQQLGNGACPDCVITASLVGSAPTRTLVCVATRSVHPLVGLALGEHQIVATQAARMEWQY